MVGVSLSTLRPRYVKSGYWNHQNGPGGGGEMAACPQEDHMRPLANAR